MPQKRAKKCAPADPEAKKKQKAATKAPKNKPEFVDSLITSYEDYDNTATSSSIKQTEVSFFNPSLEKKDSSCVYHEAATEWLWNLVCGQNLILYGIGSHKKMLSEFRHLCMEGEDVLEFSGNPSPSHHQESGENNWIQNMTQVLRSIANDILELKHFPIPEDPVMLCLLATRLAEYLDVHYGRGHRVQDDQEGLLVRRSRSRSLHNIQPALPRYKRGRYQHNQTRLFLVIHDLCGPALGPHAEGLTIFAALCRGGRSVSFISSISSFSLPLHLSPLVLNSLNVQWIHAPTYAAYPVPKDHPLFGGRSTAATTTATAAANNTADDNDDIGDSNGQSNIASTSTSILPQGRIVPANTVYMVLKALGQATRDLMQLLCTAVLPLQANKRDVPISLMIQRAGEKLLIKKDNYNDLRGKLSELFEQKLIDETGPSIRVNPITRQMEQDMGRITLLIPDQEIVNLANGIQHALYNDDNDNEEKDGQKEEEAVVAEPRQSFKQTKTRKRSRDDNDDDNQEEDEEDQQQDTKDKNQISKSNLKKYKVPIVPSAPQSNKTNQGNKSKGKGG